MINKMHKFLFNYCHILYLTNPIHRNHPLMLVRLVRSLMPASLNYVDRVSPSLHRFEFHSSADLPNAGLRQQGDSDSDSDNRSSTPSSKLLESDMKTGLSQEADPSSPAVEENKLLSQDDASQMNYADSPHRRTADSNYTNANFV